MPSPSASLRVQAVSNLNMPDVLHSVPPRTFNTSQRRSRAKMDEAIDLLPQSEYDLLVGASAAKKRRIDSSTSRLDEIEFAPPFEEGQFFESVPDQCRHERIAMFIDATGSKATASAICVVCAGTFFRTEVDSVLLEFLRNTNKLCPAFEHPAHVLTDGMLLHHNPDCYLTDTAGNSCATICLSCLGSLRNGKMPSLSLANGLWIGDVPLVLHVLTLPERVLVARFFPAAYIVKLYPMKKGARFWPSDGFHSGVRGNVSTYRLNTDDIVEMTDTQTMPPSSSILAATIGVTFVGPHNLPQKTMPGFLRVNRNRVHDALLWLKLNNPVYRDIVISADRLSQLPLDGVPDEIYTLAKHSDDLNHLGHEHDGYVPDGSDSEDGMSVNRRSLFVHVSYVVRRLWFGIGQVRRKRFHSFHWRWSVLFYMLCGNGLFCDTGNAEAIPLHALGVVDVAANDVPDNVLLASALHNVTRSDRADGWAVKRSSDFVNEYPCLDSDGNHFEGTTENPNHLLGSFPCLFPYGVGGFEVGRPLHVTYDRHAHWALRYKDKRFRKDLYFIFQIFGVIQKRELCASAALQISKRTYLQFEHAIRSLHASDFEKAAQQEHSHERFTDPTMICLRQTLNTVRSKVIGTDESRIRIRSLIWGMCIKKNPPSLWLTINPADTQDPIAQVLCGEEIDLDSFCAIDHRANAAAVAADPFASASFFHLIINAVLQQLLGVKGYGLHQGLIYKKGIFGFVSAFIGTVEAQGRGTLHLHMLLWLKGSVPSARMKSLLQSEQFRERVKIFIGTNICAHVPDFNGHLLLSSSKDNAVSFSRPVDPRRPAYDTFAKAAEFRTVRAVQIHQCTRACLRLFKGRWGCKRRAPFPLANDAWVDENGDWGPMRLYGFVNNFCPSLVQTLRANHDIKLVTNGESTKNLAWYISKYATKPQDASTNMSALLAKTYAFQPKDQTRSPDLCRLNKKLIQRCANTLSREQELSAPQVVSYLMGWGDRFISHHFETIHWYAVVNLLKKCYPILSESMYVSHLFDSPLARILLFSLRNSRSSSHLGTINPEEDSDTTDVRILRIFAFFWHLIVAP